MDTDARFTGSIPERYASSLGPMFFEPYALDIATRVRLLAARRILEIAAGTGVVTRALSSALPASEIEATDLSPDMVAYGASHGAPGVKWSVADAQALPFEDGRFDLVVCQFGVMFFPERLSAFRETRRVLSPRGEFHFNVWDDLAHNDVARFVHQAAVSTFPEDPPRFVERVPYGHCDVAGIEGDLRAAGFSEVAWEAVSARSHAPSARDAAIGVCEGTPLRHEIVKRDPARLPLVIETAARGIRDALGAGPIEGEMRAFVFSAK